MRKSGLAAITLRDGDDLIEVKYTDGNQDIFFATKKGMAIRFKESEVRATGRGSMGVLGIRLRENDEVIGMQLRSQGDFLLFATENGIGKITAFDDFHVQGRGGYGVKCIGLREKTGDLVGVKAVNRDNEVMLITSGGIIIRTPVDGISLLSRSATGVKLMNVKDSVAGIAKVREDQSSEEETDSEEEVTGDDVPEEKENQDF